jgi:hypothetical protein
MMATMKPLAELSPLIAGWLRWLGPRRPMILSARPGSAAVRHFYEEMEASRLGHESIRCRLIPTPSPREWLKPATDRVSTKPTTK